MGKKYKLTLDLISQNVTHNYKDMISYELECNLLRQLNFVNVSQTVRNQLKLVTQIVSIVELDIQEYCLYKSLSFINQCDFL